MLSKKQKQTLKDPCPLCSAKLQDVGDLSDFKHDIIMCTACQFTLMYNGTTCD